jgi:hypothetical protein
MEARSGIQRREKLASFGFWKKKTKHFGSFLAFYRTYQASVPDHQVHS